MPEHQEWLPCPKPATADILRWNEPLWAAPNRPRGKPDKIGEQQIAAQVLAVGEFLELEVLAVQKLSAGEAPLKVKEGDKIRRKKNDDRPRFVSQAGNSSYMSEQKEKLEFLSALEKSLSDGSFVKLSLSNYHGDEADLKNIHARKILVKKEEKLSLTSHYKTRDLIKNYNLPDGIAKIQGALQKDFQAGTLFTTSFDLVLRKKSLKKNKPLHTEPLSADHDLAKKRLIKTSGKSYLRTLNITDNEGNVFKNAQDKYRQINKFVEIMSGLIKDLPPHHLKKIVDMGAGKGYLTFALYDYLQTLGLPTEVTGVERRADLVNASNKIAVAANFNRLNFVEGTIENYDSTGTNILIALHACDTATDDAIYKGITADADLIVVAPCCHKQVRREIEKNKPENALNFLIKHGIFLERHAEMLTDGLRGLILEYFGYRVKIFEFISDAHTPKNILIVGIKNGKSALDKKQILEKIREKKSYFGIGYHYLEKLLAI